MVKEGFKLRRFLTSDWDKFKKIRLEALQVHPDLFTPSKNEFEFSKKDWIARLSNPDAATFGLYLDNEVVGLTGIVIDRNDSTRAILVMSYIRNPFRNKGLSSLFYERRLDWAKKRGDIKIVESGHVEGNVVSYKANQKFGFSSRGFYDHKEKDGTSRRVFIYELPLNRA